MQFYFLCYIFKLQVVCTKESNFKGKVARRESVRVQTNERGINIPGFKNYSSNCLFLKKKILFEFSLDIQGLAKVG